MTYITEFAIEGLAGRKGLYTQKLNRDVNIFFGLNGSGKTTLLKLLHAALSNDISIISKSAFVSAEIKFYSKSLDKVFTRTYSQSATLEIPVPTGEDIAPFVPEDWVFYQTQLNQLRLKLPETEWKIKPKPSRPLAGLRHSYLPTSRLLVAANRTPIGTAIKTEEELDSAFEGMIVALWARYIGEVLGEVRQVQEAGLANILKWILAPDDRSQETTKPLDVNTAFERVNSFLARQNPNSQLSTEEEFAKRYRSSSVLKRVVNFIDEVELKIERATAPRDKLQQLIGELFSGSKHAVFTDKSIEIVTDEKGTISLASLSAGEKHILRILVEVLRGADNCLLIDEPEISMHIDWQKDLVSAMQTVNGDVQLILATHSPEIMANINDDKIFSM